MAAKLYPVPERVSAGSESPMSTLDEYRGAYARSVADPDGFWLDVTNSLIQWMKAPTQGLEGSYHDIAEGPIKPIGNSNPSREV